MPEGSHSVLHQGPMEEEYPRLPSPLSAGDHEQRNADLESDCYHQLCADPLDGEGQRPVSLVSTLSSGSSRDSHSLFGSTVTLPSSCTPPIPSEEDIDLELSPAESAVEQTRDQSPGLAGFSRLWKPHLMLNQWNNNNATTNRKSAQILHNPASPVVTETMAPNPKLTHVDRVVMEIIETERMYVKDLRSIVEDYLAHIIDTSNLPMRPEQVCALFGNIEDIYEFNSELLQSLDMCDNDPVAIAQCFVEKSEYFEIYTQYCTNYPNSVATLTDCMRSKTLAMFFKDRQAFLKRSLPLGSFLLKPVQRILKYHLLLQEIAKHFGPDEEGYEVIQEAIDTMTGVAWYINDMKRKHEHAVRVQEIQSLLINWKGPDLTTYGELVLEGTFHVLRAKNSRTLFLFEKMLLITKRRGEHYVYKTHISCSTLMLLDSAKDPLLFSVIHFKHPKQPHTVQAKSVEEKRLWAHHIKRLILENHNAIVPPKAKEAIVDNANCVGKYHCSPERVKRADSYQSSDIHLAGWNGRRRSEPAKQIIKNTKDVLKHAESESALLGDKPQASSLSEGERPAAEDAVQQLSSTPEEVPSSPHEGGPKLPMTEQQKQEDEEGDSFKEDLLMGDDQVADFASSVLAAISCWHYRARALLSSHFTTDDEVGDPAQLTDAPGKETQETHSHEESQRDAAETKQVHLDEPHPSDCVSQVEDIRQQSESSLEAFTPDSAETSRETGEEAEGESDSSGLQVEETSALMSSELSEEEEEEEEEEVVAGNKRILPCSVLGQASVIAERFITGLPRRSSLVSEDLGSMACSSPLTRNEVFISPSTCTDSEEKSPTVSPPEPQANPETVCEPVPVEGERRSTLSKQDLLLIHKIRRYYEHAEHQDANFSIKRRESLSYIPAGLVRQLSKQLNNIPDQHAAVPVHRKVLSRYRPTSWSVFDLPGLEKNPNTDIEQKAERQRSEEVKARSPSVTDSSTTDEDFRPSSEMIKVWQDMESEEEVQQTGEEEKNPFECLDSSECKLRKQPSLILEETSPSSDGSDVLLEDSARDCKQRRTSMTQGKSLAQLPRLISFRTSVDEDQILQDMGKMKNKVFQLARQYSQRIKNNRPMVWQRNREASSQQGFKSMPAVLEEKVKKKSKPNLRLPLNACDQMVIHEVNTPSPVQTPSSAASSRSTLTDPQSPQLENFHWPDVQELCSKYNPSQLDADSSNSMLECSPAKCNCCSHTDSHKDPTQCPEAQPETWYKERGDQDRPRPRSKLLCRWSSLEHMLGSLPLHEVQNLQEPVRTCRPSSLASLTAAQCSVLAEGDQQLEDSSQCPGKSAAPSSAKTSESNLVKSLREKFQSLSTSSSTC
ncbi:pleckstrin homology domain-containing family G member 3 isoform X1 [Syngnathus scovelli]|uniref:pleckstrin homology domain-containing family G member 3 isoform X1 n=1 Tax=Syngnathus scovelli TaxID=161590 RepID=UPI00211072B2|nr:pleckstrin homology domain-containing family G member 3 isoform X1 [Syngnathus scovelli]XP_049597487.1 pleckstrin homology domain-containing family G member 3 isoform X1 [Syngnathus scovelli]